MPLVNGSQDRLFPIRMLLMHSFPVDGCRHFDCSDYPLERQFASICYREELANYINRIKAP